jgi:hypothetical protein
VVDYIESGITPEDDKESKSLIKKVTRFAITEGLFRKGISTPLLKCIGPVEVGYVLAEIHEACCGHHVGAKSLARKALRAGYFWPTMQEDAANHVKKSEQCQRHENIPHIPPEELHTLVEIPSCGGGLLHPVG